MLQISRTGGFELKIVPLIIKSICLLLLIIFFVSRETLTLQQTRTLTQRSRTLTQCCLHVGPASQTVDQQEAFFICGDVT